MPEVKPRAGGGQDAEEKCIDAEEKCIDALMQSKADEYGPVADIDKAMEKLELMTFHQARRQMLHRDG